MSRIRSIKPEFWTSEQVMECSPLARLAFIGMWNFCDDQGVHPGSVKTLKAEVFPADDISSAQVGELVDELIANDLIAFFSAEGKAWWSVTGWHHQLIKNPSAPKYPSPPAQSQQEDYPIPTPAIPQPYPSPTPGGDPGREGKGREIGKEGKGEKPAQQASNSVQARREKPAADAAVVFDAAEFLIEQGANQQTADDYLTLRRSKRAPATRTALQAVVSEIGKASMTLQDGIALCCNRGWSGFKADWVESNLARAGPRSIHDERKATLDELTGRNRHATEKSEPRDISAEVIRLA